MLSMNVSIDIKFYNQHSIFTQRIKQAAGEKQSEQNRLNNTKKILLKIRSAQKFGCTLYNLLVERVLTAR